MLPERRNVPLGPFMSQKDVSYVFFFFLVPLTDEARTLTWEYLLLIAEPVIPGYPTFQLI